MKLLPSLLPVLLLVAVQLAAAGRQIGLCYCNVGVCYKHVGATTVLCKTDEDFYGAGGEGRQEKEREETHATTTTTVEAEIRNDDNT